MSKIKKKMLMQKVHLFPNFITAFGLSCGLFIIFNMILKPEFNEDTMRMTTVFFLLACVADMLDGTVARLIQAESEFGVFFDSISDAITFGVAPIAVVLKSLAVEEMALPVFMGAIIFSLCGVLRLVRYSVEALHEKHPHKEKDLDNAGNILRTKENFTGLPIPAAALALTAANFFFMSKEFRAFFIMSDIVRACVIMVIMVLMGYFMISTWKFPSLKMFHMRVPTFHMVFFSAVAAAFLIYGVMTYFFFAFAVAAWSYIVIAWGGAVIRLMKGKNILVSEDE
jgi:CDP-diacylglycerol---serine O-phosphatidyltransferase